jgi:hypothetical protein
MPDPDPFAAMTPNRSKIFMTSPILWDETKPPLEEWPVPIRLGWLSSRELHPQGFLERR